MRIRKRSGSKADGRSGSGEIRNGPGQPRRATDQGEIRTI